MKPYTRADRVAVIVQRTLSDILLREVKDPRLAMAQITGVRMTKDLRHARVYFVTTGGDKTPEEVAEGFRQARGVLKRFLGRELDLRYMPEIEFFHDSSYDYGSKIEKLLHSIRTDNG